MKREVDINDISDGRMYELNDMVKADCGDCKGCHTCCTGMGNSIILDPLDIHLLKSNLGMSFEELIGNHIELNIVDRVILPNLKMGKGDACTFLDEEGRCSIHNFRPGICRIFPLGRLYEDGGFKYILQTNECQKQNRTKIKVKKWIDTPQLEKNQKFINDWHYFLKDVENYLMEKNDETLMKQLEMFILKLFYMKNFNVSGDFYEEFHDRLMTARAALE